MRKETAMKEPSQIEKSLREMYELGKKHGYNLAVKDMEIKKLQHEIKVIEGSK